MGIKFFRFVEKLVYIPNVLHQLSEDAFCFFRSGKTGHQILSKPFTIFEKQPVS